MSLSEGGAGVHRPETCYGGTVVVWTWAACSGGRFFNPGYAGLADVGARGSLTSLQASANWSGVIRAGAETSLAGA